MSVNEIDVNAVNERTRQGSVQKCCDNGFLDEPHDCQKQKGEEQTEHIVALSKFIKGSLRWRLAYFMVKFIMVLESLVWTIMDLLRAWRMRLTARINDNYQLNTKK